MPFVKAAILHEDAAPGLVTRLQTELSRLAVEALGKVGQLVSVLVEPIPAGSWAVGGQPVERAAHVSIAVTSGTNTTAEKAAFVSQAHALLRALLGPDLPEATYVIVDEVPAEAWGYAGVTAAQRRIDTTP